MTSVVYLRTIDSIVTFCVGFFALFRKNTKKKKKKKNETKKISSEISSRWDYPPVQINSRWGYLLLVKNRLQDIFPLVYLALAFKNYFILKLLEKWKSAHTYYKELVADKENIFKENISQNNQVENIKFSKSHEYGVTGMAIKPDIGSYSLIKVSDKQKLKEISEKIQDLVKKIKN